MIKRFLYRVLERRHFWRYATFSEIAELYASRTIRVIALNIVSGFTSVYLYEEGYSLAFIMLFWLLFYLFKIPASVLSAFFVARFGPKHGVLVSNILYVPALSALGFLPAAREVNMEMLSIGLWGFFMLFSAALYKLSYTVDFSKIKNAEHVGKELAFMNILEKVSIGISPIVGGLIALWFGLQSVIWMAAVLFILSALPLLRSVEPIETHQKISFRGFPWRANISNLFAQTGVGFDFVTTGTIWHLFIVVVILPGHGWDIYVKLGFLSSVTIVTALAASYIYGKLIDNSRGGVLLKVSVVANAIVHAMRPFVNSTSSIVGTNISNEIATTGYNMAFMRGVFDAADLSGHRIVYLCIGDAIASAGAALACLIFIVCNALMGDQRGFTPFFLVAAFFVLLIGTAHFNLYKKDDMIY